MLSTILKKIQISEKMKRNGVDVFCMLSQSKPINAWKMLTKMLEENTMDTLVTILMLFAPQQLRHQVANVESIMNLGPFMTRN